MSVDTRMVVSISDIILVVVIETNARAKYINLYISYTLHTLPEEGMIKGVLNYGKRKRNHNSSGIDRSSAAHHR